MDARVKLPIPGIFIHPFRQVVSLSLRFGYWDCEAQCSVLHARAAPSTEEASHIESATLSVNNTLFNCFYSLVHSFAKVHYGSLHFSNTVGY